MAEGVAAAAPMIRGKSAAVVTRAGARSSGVLLRRVAGSLVIAPPVLLGVYAGGAWFLLGTAIVTFLALREFYSRLVTMARRDDSLTQSHSIEEAEERHSAKLATRKRSHKG